LIKAYEKCEQSCVSTWLIPHAGSPLYGETVAYFENHVAQSGGSVFAGLWREGLDRPFGGLGEVLHQLAHLLAKQQPEVVRRYGRILITLFPALRQEASLSEVQARRSVLTDLALKGDRSGLFKFFTRINRIALTVSSVVNFLVDAVNALAQRGGRPVVIILDRLDRADEQSLEAIQLLTRYAEDLPLLIVASVSEAVDHEASTALSKLTSGGHWAIHELDTSASDIDQWLADRLSPAAIAELATVSTFSQSFDLPAWNALRPDAKTTPPITSLEQLHQLGIVRRLEEGRWSLATATVQEVLYRRLGASARPLHACLAAAEGEDDPFGAAWHERGCGRDDHLHRASLVAMERAWAISAFGSALAHAETAVATQPPESTLNGDLLLGLLHYEAERYEQADHYLQLAPQQQPPPGISVQMLELLVGYNAIVGLGEMERGRAILQTVLDDSQADGPTAAYLRNSIAFTLFRTRQAEAAMDLEKVAFGDARQGERQDSHLETLLYLNQGRLYRNAGDHDEAVTKISQSLLSQKGELSQQMLLISLTALAQLHGGFGDYRAASRYFYFCLQLLHGIDIETTDERAMSPLTLGLGPTDGATLSHGEKTLFYLQFQLAKNCRFAGLTAEYEAYWKAIEPYRESVGEEVWAHVKSAMTGALEEAAQPPQEEKVSDKMATLWMESDPAEPFVDLVSETSRGSAAIVQAAEQLASRGIIAYVVPRENGCFVDSLLLFDPRRQESIAPVLSEILGREASELPGARTALICPRGLPLFSHGLAPAPLCLRQGSLLLDQRSRFPGLLPVRCRLRVLDPKLDGALAALIEHFASKTGVPFVAAMPFYLRNLRLALTPSQALANFLVGSLDRMLLGDRLLAKVHNSTAGENLLPFRPRVSRQARILPPRSEDSTEPVIIRVRSERSSFPTRFLKLRGETRPLLAMLDGDHTIDQVVEQAGQGNRLQVAGFVRQLWHQGVIRLEETDPRAMSNDHGKPLGAASGPG